MDVRCQVGLVGSPPFGCSKQKQTFCILRDPDFENTLAAKVLKAVRYSSFHPQFSPVCLNGEPRDIFLGFFGCPFKPTPRVPTPKENFREPTLGDRPPKEDSGQDALHGQH